MKTVKELLEAVGESVVVLEKAFAELRTSVEKADRVELAKLAAGDEFTTDIGTFIVLEQMEEGTKVIMKDFYKKNVRFGDSTNYKESEVHRLCEEEIYPEFCDVFGEDNIITHTVDLTTVDMQNPYGTVECDVRVLTFDEVRKYNNLLVNKELPDWWWTCTPWSTKERGWSYSVAVVSPSGDVSYDICDDVNGVRPVCILRSDIFVSLVKED